jgi:uncharacterized membrane protein YbhN (UPF0104 family)
MSQKPSSLLSNFQSYKVVIPVIIGLGVVLFMFWGELNEAGDALNKVQLSWRFWCFIALAVVFMAGRDVGYMLRLRLLSEGELSWRQALRVVVLWEFTSAITPSAVGGTSVAILYVNKEGISAGRSTAIVMATSLLDEIYFVLMFPLLVLIVSPALLFAGTTATGDTLLWATIAGYGIKLSWVLLLLYGLFVRPHSLRWLLIKVFSLPILRRWKQDAVKVGDDVVVSASALRHRSAGFWLRSLAATFVSWTSRYWVVNALMLAFALEFDQLEVFARQLVMWIMMLVSPTPGGSGFAEYVFKTFLSGPNLIPVGLVVVIALLWRFITYYVYLIVGVTVMPRWVKNKFGKDNKNSRKQAEE